MGNQKLIKLISRLLIAFGVLIVNLALFTFIGNYLCIFLYKVNVSELLTSVQFSKPNPTQIDALRLFFAINSIGTFIVSSFVIALIFKEKTTEYLGISHLPKPIFFILTPLLLVISMPFLNWLITINSQLDLPNFMAGFEKSIKSMEDKNDLIQKNMLNMPNLTSYFINIIVMALIPAVGEELFCRGILFNVVYDYSGKLIRSILSVALVFTLFHMQIYKFAPMMVLAIFLGLLVFWTSGIWASILFHFLNNTLIVTGSYLSQRGTHNFLTDEHLDLPFYSVILSFILTIIFIFQINKFSKKLSTSEHE